MQMASIGEKIAAYEALREQAEAAKQALAEANKQLDAAEQSVISAMLDMEEEAGTGMRVTFDGRNYSVTVKSYYSIPKGSRDQAFEQLRDLGMGDLIQEKVDDRTLTKELETLREESGGQMPDEYGELIDMLNTYDKTTLRRIKA